jgi:hypothetical protein
VLIRLLFWPTGAGGARKERLAEKFCSASRAIAFILDT